jgi:hypothetical protein
VIALSPGLAQGCFELLNLVARSTLTLSDIRLSFARFGNTDSGKVVEIAQSLFWLRVAEGGVTVLSQSGERLVSVQNYERMLRQALLDYVDTERPAWIQNATHGRARVLAFAGTETAQTFVEADLASSTDEDVVAFWDALAARARGQKNDYLTRIGRRGERHTLSYEKSRTGRAPKWVSVEDNADGYDVLSIVDSKDLRPLSIEVKASTLGIAGRLHLSRNEWERSIEADSHIFHLWSFVNNNPGDLAIVSPKEMESHIPRDAGDGSWEVVEIPFAAFRDRFASPAQVARTWE